MFNRLSNSCRIRSFGESLVLASNFEESLKCVSLNNRPYQARQTTINIKTLINHFIIYLILVLLSVAEVVILSMVHVLEHVFQIKQKI